MGIKQSTRRPYAERREPYLLVFLVSFAILMVVILPVMIFTGGYFIYYGDFNSQQLPFYWLAHEAVQNGAFGWNWMTDLGANFIGSYSFYLLGSPFFWLTVPFPQEWVLGALSGASPHPLSVRCSMHSPASSSIIFSSIIFTMSQHFSRCC